MRLKSYYVQTMEEALQTAKMELGEDAMLVGSKRLETAPGSRARLEVIFASPVTPPPPPKVAAHPERAAANTAAGLRRFRGELTTLLDALSRRPDAARLEPLTPAGPQLDALRARLLLAEVPGLAIEETLSLCRPALEGLSLRGITAIAEAESAILPLLVAGGPRTAGRESSQGRMLAFAGPAGAGKTTAITKLAFRLGISEGLPVSVFSVDNLRVGASDPLAHVCCLLGVPYQSLDYSGALRTALANRPHRGLILIDTPGYGPADVDVMEESAAELSRIEGLECQLVLPATLRYSDLWRLYRQFSVFAPSRLLYTRLDETEFFGPAWALAAQTGVPVEWVTTGPGIADGLEEADAGRFATSLLGHGTYKTGDRQSSRRARAAGAGA